MASQNAAAFKFGSSALASFFLCLRHCYGPSQDYFQESGRAVRDGSLCNVILYYYPGCLLGHVSPTMNEYCKQSTMCRRTYPPAQFNFSVKQSENFLSHHCCDICSASWLPCSYQLQPLETMTCSGVSIATDEDEGCRVVTPEQKKQLWLKLYEFRDQQCTLQGDLNISLYVGVNVALGLTPQVIESVVNNCEYINSDTLNKNAF